MARIPLCLLVTTALCLTGSRVIFSAPVSGGQDSDTGLISNTSYPDNITTTIPKLVDVNKTTGGPKNTFIGTTNVDNTTTSLDSRTTKSGAISTTAFSETKFTFDKTKFTKNAKDYITAETKLDSTTATSANFHATSLSSVSDGTWAPSLNPNTTSSLTPLTAASLSTLTSTDFTESPTTLTETSTLTRYPGQTSTTLTKTSKTFSGYSTDISITLKQKSKPLTTHPIQTPTTLTGNSGPSIITQTEARNALKVSQATTTFSISVPTSTHSIPTTYTSLYTSKPAAVASKHVTQFKDRINQTIIDHVTSDTLALSQTSSDGNIKATMGTTNTVHHFLRQTTSSGDSFSGDTTVDSMSSTSDGINTSPQTPPTESTTPDSGISVFKITTTGEKITTTGEKITTTGEKITTTGEKITTTEEKTTTTADKIITTADKIITTADKIITTADKITTTADIITTTADIITTTADKPTLDVPKSITPSIENTTVLMITDSGTVIDSRGDTTTPKRGATAGSVSEPPMLTVILIAICASLFALLLIICVVAYIKFRKKSRSIRKKLTFKDDAIYDNPIYHGRWEVPQAPEPAPSSCPRSLPMLISALPEEVLRLAKDDDTGFNLQFMMLNKLSPNAPQQAARDYINVHKNRYRDILPFDHNRVQLEPDEDQSDYINASFVPGVRSEREYVVSQGPLERTVADHWRMIWELNIRVIAMLTTCEEGDLIFKSKCHQYWPNKENELVKYGGIYVTLVSSTRLCRDNYKLKVLHIRKGKDSEPRKVQLFQYIKWPDRKNPEDPGAFLEYRDHVRRELESTEDQLPMLVHCSAGVGRTGTFVATDTLLQHMEERESVDVYGLVLRLRKYRVLLVQNVSQYKFVHTSLLAILDKRKKAEVDELRRQGSGTHPYENMVMGQRAVVGELGGLVHRGEESDVPLQQSSALQNFLRKSKSNVQPESDYEDYQCQIPSEGMPSPVRVDEWPRPLSDPVPRPLPDTPKSKAVSSKGDSGRALAKELGGMFHIGQDINASPGKTAAIKAFLRNRDLENDSQISQDDSPQTDALVIDNRFRDNTEKQTTCL